jgi:hypothetical protein
MAISAVPFKLPMTIFPVDGGPRRSDQHSRGFDLRRAADASSNRGPKVSFR